LKVLVSTSYVRAFPGGVGFAKAAGNYAASLQPTTMAQTMGYDQLIWLDGVNRKYVEEFGTMNLFFIINNKLITPVCKGTILEGITRDSILKLARHLGIETEVRKVSIDEILEAHQNGELQDAFGSGTAATITHLARITYQDFEIELPPADQRTASILLKKTLSEIRMGQIPDPFGWVTPLKTIAPELV
jgi:branched-chain amino acid aminotransferase